METVWDLWLLISHETIEKRCFLQQVVSRAGAFLGKYSKERQRKTIYEKMITVMDMEPRTSM